MASSSDAPLAFLATNPVFSGLSDVYNAFQERRGRLGLSNPGLVENIAKGTSPLPSLSLGRTRAPFQPLGQESAVCNCSTTTPPHETY